jgi:hypothetical protein
MELFPSLRRELLDRLELIFAAGGQTIPIGPELTAGWQERKQCQISVRKVVKGVAVTLHSNPAKLQQALHLPFL